LALESASYINQLNAANPSPTDLLGQGDDHIRLLKTVLKATFPNLTGPFALSNDDVDDLVLAVQRAAPVGLIANWWGLAADVPAGWAICNGQTVARSDGAGNIVTPDLRDKVIIGAGTVAGELQAFGAATAAATSSSAGGHTHGVTGTGTHTHSVAVAGHALTVDEIPPHSHTVSNGIGSSTTYAEGGRGGTNYTMNTGSTGGGVAHSHDATISGDGGHTHELAAADGHTHTVTVATYQPSVSLHFIMKV
jgi:hypothetical protein